MINIVYTLLLQMILENIIRRIVVVNSTYCLNKITQNISQQSIKSNTQYKLPYLSNNQLHNNNMIMMHSYSQKELQQKIIQKNNKFTSVCSDKQFKRAEQKISNLYEYIRSSILPANEFQDDRLRQATHYYFQKQGKKLRPIMVHLLADSITNTYPRLNHHQQKVQLWSALIEIMHIASLAHDDIIDDSPSRRGQQSPHLKYGKQLAVFSANYIISKAHKLYDLKNADMYRIYSIAMDDLANGEIIQMLSKNKLTEYGVVKKSQQISQQDVTNSFQTYLNKTYYKTGALISNSLRAVPLIFRGNVEWKEQQLQLNCFRVGQHFGIAFQIVDDILDYVSTEQQMGKKTMSDLLQGYITSPIYLSLLRQYKLLGKPNKEMVQILIKLNKKNEDIQKIKSWITQQGGIQRSYLLAWGHIQTAIQHLQKMNVQSIYLEAWKYLALKILNRRK